MHRPRRVFPGTVPAKASSCEELALTKRELVIDVAERLGFTQNEVAGVVQTTLDSILEALARGDRLEIRNFGVFETKRRNARTGRNPRTGDAVPIQRKRVVSFKPGKAIKEMVDGAVETALTGERSD